LGFPEECLTYIKVNKDFKMDTQELVKTINEDKARGLQALCLIGTAGSTNTGAVDNISELANVAQEHNLWLHIDAAYGGFFMLTKKGQLTLNGLERADSIALDPHKSLSLPYGTGCLIVRDGQSMKFKDSGSRSYMPPTPESHEGPTQEMEFADISNELSRDYRGLRFWLPIKTLGIGPFQLNLEEKLELAHYLFNELKSIPGIEVITEPQLTVVNFKMKNTSKTRELLTKINQTHQFFLSGCTIEDNFVIRVCLLGFRLHFDKVQSLIQVIRQSLKELGE
jgi:aromatic-L-amino-acid decarboxylase